MGNEVPSAGSQAGEGGAGTLGQTGQGEGTEAMAAVEKDVRAR